MIKTVQLISLMKRKNFTLGQVLDEFHEIVDNGQSTLAVLSERDVQRISDVFHDDKKFGAVLSIYGF